MDALNNLSSFFNLESLGIILSTESKKEIIKERTAIIIGLLPVLTFILKDLPEFIIKNRLFG